MNHEALLKLLNAFHAARALVLGDVMLDRFVYGSVERISPEAPIPVIAVERTADMPGGAGNVVRNLAALGARASLVSVVGDDACAEILRAQLAQLPTVQTSLIIDASRPTTVKTRYVADGQQVLRADIERREPLSHDIECRLLDAYRSALAGTDIVILSDYAKGVLSESVLGAAISAARAAGKRVIADPKSKSFAKYRGASVLTPNRHELQGACDVECRSDRDVELGARRWLQDGICDMMVVTRGKDGMSVIRSDAAAEHLRTTAREVFDVSGAGDTVVAAMALGLAAGGEIVEACTLANVAAGIVVGKPGTAIVTTSEMISALRPSDGRADHHKLFSLASVVQLARDWRKQGLKIAFTNGCFDLLHPGHISLIDQARRAADRLIVGLNADSSIRRLKGPGRPAQAEVARATVLASLKSVDAVVIFSEDTPLELIDAIQPDVLVKGADYRLDEVVGAEMVLQRGGEVILADLVPGRSTTDTLKRVVMPGPKWAV
jgi:D-beta-D-heptose 7-phosphate kinase/D-beta-D-heptose 1-phosphate adenosyltransferase